MSKALVVKGLDENGNVVEAKDARKGRGAKDKKETEKEGGEDAASVN